MEKKIKKTLERIAIKEIEREYREYYQSHRRIWRGIKRFIQAI